MSDREDDNDDEATDDLPGIKFLQLVITSMIVTSRIKKTNMNVIFLRILRRLLCFRLLLIKHLFDKNFVNFVLLYIRNDFLHRFDLLKQVNDGTINMRKKIFINAFRRNGGPYADKKLCRRYSLS